MNNILFMEQIASSLNINYLYPIQQHVILNSIDDKNQIVILPTGAGKSICFLGSILAGKGVHIIVYPLLALMNDQERRMEEAGFHVFQLRGGQSEEDRKNLYKSLSDLETAIIISNPETLMQKSVLSQLQAFNIRQMIIDEAHTVVEWGESFRPAYLELQNIITKLNPKQISAYTATASKEIVDKIRTYLFSEHEEIVVEEIPDRPNVFYAVIPSLSKLKALRDILKQERKPVVIYFRNRREVELVAQELKKILPPWTVYAYHAGLEKSRREEIETEFFSADSGVLCSTTAYGLGVDKKNIRTIIHYTIAPRIESYLQESGRAGRDREPAKAFMLLSPEDIENILRTNNSREMDLLEVFTGEKCLRDGLLELMGHSLEYCSGCDICSQNRHYQKRAVKRHSKNFRQEALTFIGSINGLVLRKNLWLKKDYGKLNDYSVSEALEYVKNNVILNKPDFANQYADFFEESN